MKFSDKYQYTILCEDKKTKMFIVNILKLQGINPYKIYTDVSPSGIGSGEAFVRRRYPARLKALRAGNFKRLVLIVCTDADQKTINERKDFLNQICLEHKPPIDKRKKGEAVIFWIPKRHIETWIQFFGGNYTITEDAKILHTGEVVKCKKEAENMSEYLQEIQKIDKPLPSIADAKAEYDALCKLFV